MFLQFFISENDQGEDTDAEDVVNYRGEENGGTVPQSAVDRKLQQSGYGACAQGEQGREEQSLSPAAEQGGDAAHNDSHQARSCTAAAQGVHQKGDQAGTEADTGSQDDSGRNDRQAHGPGGRVQGEAVSGKGVGGKGAEEDGEQDDASGQPGKICFPFYVFRCEADPQQQIEGQTEKSCVFQQSNRVEQMFFHHLSSARTPPLTHFVIISRFSSPSRT